MTTARQKYPIGEQDFKSLIEDGYTYVDKTGIIYDLVNQGKYYFLARPRRFGKSLLLSTLRYYFEGRKDLFEGLEIYNLETKWEKHPVFLLSLARFTTSIPNSLESILLDHIIQWEKEYGKSNEDLSLPSRFKQLLKRAYEKTGKRVVILIDEYDAPLVSTMNEVEKHEGMRGILKSFYTNLKDNGEYIKFAMLTGVSRFSKMTVFSGLNNLNDITFDDEYGAICGITYEEIEKKLAPGIERIAENMELSFEEMLAKLKNYYDGYHFSKRCPDIYNPFSLLNALQKRELGTYWAQTGTPTFLIERIKEKHTNIRELLNSAIKSADLGSSDLAYSSDVALLFQTGYLTIKSYDKSTQRYQLGIPNFEVESSLFRNFMQVYQYPDSNVGSNILLEIEKALNEGKPEEAMERFQSYLAGIGYPIGSENREFAFQNNLLIPLKLIGLDVKSELHISNGRIDMTVNTSDYIYLFEFKLDKSAEEALKQINEKEYTLPWKFDGRHIIKIGVNFSSEKRNIDSWLIETSDL